MNLRLPSVFDRSLALLIISNELRKLPGIFSGYATAFCIEVAGVEADAEVDADAAEVVVTV